MIEYSTFTLNNGLKVLVHPNRQSNLVTFNLLYNVGARDENPDQTGLAHFFEHMMFEGTKEVRDFDHRLQLAGASHNAFTCNDYTNYYITLPYENIETAFWLESDRMMHLDIHQEKLETQKKVVIEEFKQRYINQPYGDLWSELRKLSFKKHPYQWQTIGKSIEHIENIDMNSSNSFYKAYYHPANAILGLSGNISASDAKTFCEKWFGPIASGHINKGVYIQEPLQEEGRLKVIEKEVPSDVLIKAYKSSGRKGKDYHALKMLSLLLSGGKSSRIKNALIDKKKVFLNAGVFSTGELDPDLLVISATLQKGISFDDAENEVEQFIKDIQQGSFSKSEMEKVINQCETDFCFDMSDNNHIA